MSRPMMRRLTAVVIAIAMGMSTVLSAAATPSGFTPAGAKGVKVTVKCTTNPEKVIIRNDRGKAIRVTRVGSTYRPRSGEPYRVNKLVKPGKRVTFSFGTRRGPNRLTRQFIFSNTAGREGVRITTSVGTKVKRC